jgi:spore coat protein U-like protein
MNTTNGSTDCQRMAGGRRPGSRIAWLSLMLVAGACMSVQAVPTCTIASDAMLSFGAVVALASTGNVTTNSGSSFWVNCTSDVAAAPALYSATPRTLLSGGNSLPFALSLVSPGGVELPTASPGAQLSLTRNGSNQVVTLYGNIFASNFQSLSPGMYSRSITLTLEY